jgi:hypothetical protein
MKNYYFHIKKLIILLLSIVLFSCEEKNDYYSGFTATIIVEGKIELNDYPKVILTRNIPYYLQIDSADLIKMVLRQAKVTVSDGEMSEILTLKYNSSAFPPFYYQGNELIGKAGKTYYLTVDYGDIQLTATTTIPNPVLFDSVWFKPNAPGDSLGKICALLKDDPEQHNYYRTYTKIQSKQTEYYPTLVSTYDDRYFNGMDYAFQISKGPESYLDLKSIDYNYQLGDTVFLKIATIEKTVFDFWTGYKNEVVNGANPFASSYHVVKSNIVGEGKGIWAGYGSSVWKVVNK